jgi:hypothetical protein
MSNVALVPAEFSKGWEGAEVAKLLRCADRGGEDAESL